MGKFKGIKLGAKLRQFTTLRTKQQNVTRWSSSCEMVSRYLELKQVFEQHFSSEQTLLDSLLNARENQKVLEVHENLKVLDSVTLALQRESIDLSSTRLLFDEVVNRVPELDMYMKYLAPNASIIAMPNFENGVVKILDENEANLTIREKEECQSPRSCFAFCECQFVGFCNTRFGEQACKDNCDGVHELQIFGADLEPY